MARADEYASAFLRNCPGARLQSDEIDELVRLFIACQGEARAHVPVGYVLVPDNDWAVVAQFSALPPHQKKAIMAMMDAMSEERGND